MPYIPFNPAKPVTGVGDSRQAIVDYIRLNLLALRDMAVSGAGFGWDESQSGGTESQPAYEYYTKGTEKIRRAYTWGTTGGEKNNVIVTVFSYSSDSGVTWVTIGTETVTYSALGNRISTAWS